HFGPVEAKSMNTAQALTIPQHTGGVAQENATYYFYHNDLPALKPETGGIDASKASAGEYFKPGQLAGAISPPPAHPESKTASAERAEASSTIPPGAVKGLDELGVVIVRGSPEDMEKAKEQIENIK